MSILLLPGVVYALASDNSCRLFIQLRPGVKFDSQNWQSFKVISTSDLVEKAPLPSIAASTGILQIRDSGQTGFEIYWRNEANGPGMHLDREHFQKAYGTPFPTCENLRQLSSQFRPRFEQSDLALKLINGETADGFSWGHFFLALEGSMYFRYGYWVNANDLVQKYDQDLSYLRQQLAMAPKDFLPRLDFITKQIFKRENFANYCKSSNSQTSTYLYRCTACQGQTLVVLAFLKDLKFEIPASYELGVQFFKNHVRPVLWDKSKKHLMDLVYGGEWEDSLSEAVYQPTVLLEALLSGPDSGLTSAEIKSLPRPNPGCYLIESPDPSIKYAYLKCQHWSRSLFSVAKAQPAFQRNAQFIGLIDESGYRFKTHIKFPQGGDLESGKVARNDFKSTSRHVVARSDDPDDDDISRLGNQNEMFRLFSQLYRHRDAFEGETKNQLNELGQLVVDWGRSGSKPSIGHGAEVRKLLVSQPLNYSIAENLPAPSRYEVKDEFFPKLKSVAKQMTLGEYIAIVGQDREASGFDKRYPFVPVIEFSELPNVPARAAYEAKWKSLNLAERLNIFETLTYQRWEQLFSTAEYQTLYKFLTMPPEQANFSVDEIQAMNDLLQEMADAYGKLVALQTRFKYAVHLRGSLFKGTGQAASNFIDAHIRDFERLTVYHANLLAEHHRAYLDAASTWSENHVTALQNFYGLLGVLNKRLINELSEEDAATLWPEWGNQFRRNTAIAFYPEYPLLDKMLHDPDYTYTAKKNDADLQQLAKLGEYTVLNKWSPSVDIQLPQVAPKDACRNQVSGLITFGGMTVECSPSSVNGNENKIVLRQLKTLPAQLLMSIYEDQPEEYLLYPPTQLLMALSWSDELDDVGNGHVVKDMVFYPSAFLRSRTDGHYMSITYDDKITINNINAVTTPVNTLDPYSARQLEDQKVPFQAEDKPGEFWKKNALWNAGYLAWKQMADQYVSKGQFIGSKILLGYGSVRNGSYTNMPAAESMHIEDKYYLFTTGAPTEETQERVLEASPSATPYYRAFNKQPN